MIDEILIKAAQTNIETRFEQILEELGKIGLDLTDPNIQGTAKRVSKMYVRELFTGLYQAPPDTTTFPNEFGDGMLIERDIDLTSVCSHHFVPITGVCHISYIPNKVVLGLSKFHRVVRHFASKPQLQERLQHEIGNYLIDILQTENVMVVIKAVHHCCRTRGVRDKDSSTISSFCSGIYRDASVKTEFLKLISL